MHFIQPGPARSHGPSIFPSSINGVQSIRPVTKRAAAARPPDKTFGLCASPVLFGLAVGLVVEVVVELLLAALEAEKLAKVPYPGIGAVAAFALNWSRVFDPSAGGLYNRPSVVRIASAKGEHVLDDHNHAVVAVLPLLAEEPHRRSVVDV